MTRAPPSSLISSQFEQPSQPFQQQPPLSMLQRAIQQSEHQFNTNQTFPLMSNGFNGGAPFAPIDLIPPNTYPGFPIGPTSTQPPLQSQQQSPTQLNNIRLGSPQTMSSPSVSHMSPQSQQMTSPRMSGGSTLQFVPSQVLRNMSKSHK
jgi:hypothetical protein